MAGFKEYQMLFQLNASVGSGFQTTFSTGSSNIAQLQDKINALNKTQSDISSYQKQQSAIDKTKAKVDLYATQLANLQNATASTSREEAELANAIAAKEKQLTDTTAKLDQQNAALSETGAALRAAGVDTNNLAVESERLKAEAQEVATAQKQEAEAALEAGNNLKSAMSGAAAAIEAAGVVTALKKVYSALTDCSDAAAEFESSMAGVKRTVGGDEAFISELGDSFKELSTQIPISAAELASIATTAGQLGIAQDDVKTFTTVMAELGTATDLTADSAATMLAQFANITGVKDYERLGSTVAALGDSTATTASKVVEMSQGMAAAANIAGMSETDILAIAAAVGSLGIEAASGSTSMSQLITKLYKATETGDQLEDIAAVAGMTGAEFKQAWGTDAVGALDAFIQGLNNVEQNGRSAVVVLEDLGINNVRQTKAILGLASAGGLLANTINIANNAWSENSALAQKAGVMYNTTQAKLQMMGNAANNVKIAVGDALNPALSATADAVTDLLAPVAEWLSANPAVVQAVTTFIGTIGIATAGVTAYTAATKLAAAASKLLSLSLPGLGVVAAVAGALAVAVGVVSALTSANEEAARSFSELDEEYDNLLTQFDEQMHVMDLVDQYKELSTETDNLQTLMNKGFKTTVTVAKSEGKLSAEDFVDDTTIRLTPAVAKELVSTDFLKDSKIELTPEQASYLASKDFIDGGLTVELTPEQAKKLTSSSFLKSTKVKLTPEQQKYLKSDDFIDGMKVVELTPEQASKLQAAGFLEGTTVKLTAEQANALAADGFLDNTEVELTAKAKKDLLASKFMADKVVTITAQADPDKKLTAANFGISEQTLIYIAQMDSTSYDDVKTQAATLQQEVASVGSQLTQAQIELEKSNQLASALETKISGEKNRGKKTELQKQLDTVNATILEQQTNVDNLQLKYDTLSSEYSTVSTAAAELEGKENALLAVKQQLAGVTSEVASASSEQASAYQSEAEAAERDAQAQISLIRSQVYGNISEQAKAYSKSVKDAKQANEQYAETMTRLDVVNKHASETADQVSDSYLALLHSIDDASRAEGFNPDDQGFKNMVSEAALLAEIFSGGVISAENFTKQAAASAGDLADQYAYLDVTGTEWSNILQSLNDNVVDYTNSTKEADQAQSDFIDNLVNGLLSGAVELPEVEARVRDALEGEADAEQAVAEIMAEVQTGYEAAKAAKEDYTEASEELGSTELRTAEAIIDEMKALQKEYGDAYNAAYSSMSGQFKLFDSAADKIKQMKEGFNGGTKGMTNNLQSQQSYVEQYTANFTLAQQKLAAAGVSAETAKSILASLSDGSAESGAALESLANGSEEDAKKLAKSYEDLQAAKDEYAKIVADTETNFSESMASLAEELATTIASMDQSSEAAKNAQATLDAYVNAADGYVALAALKYGRVAAAAVGALKKAFAGLGIPGFAKGTKDAPKGLAIVGEEGPELVYFNGGETVIPADETERLAKENAEDAEPVGVIGGPGGGSEKNITITISPQYNVEAGVTADEVRGVLEGNTLNLREQLEELLADIKEDEERRNL